MKKNLAIKIAEAIRKQVSDQIDVFMILGSGWNEVAQIIQNPIIIPYSSLKGMPKCTVRGHAGNFVFGYVGGEYVCIMQGRFHMYEGYTPQMVTLPIDVMHELGVEKIVVTNASGGINENYDIGDVTLLSNHINLTSRNPLCEVVPNETYPVFIDMSEPYDKEYRTFVKKICSSMKVKCHEGVYMQVLGPNYETSAEIKAFKTMGADMVGMSTVMEVIKARYYGMRVLGISCITNKATGLSDEKLNHKDVLNSSINNKEKLKLILVEFLKKLNQAK
mgnify:CR=1 FL=1